MARKDEKKLASYRKIQRDYLLNSNLTMFEYEGLPDSVNPYFTEYYLQSQGCVVWCKVDGELVTIEGGTAGNLDVYGIGKDVVATTRNGKSFNLKNDETCIVGYNNPLGTPCGDIFTDAATLADIQTSLDFLIFWTRLSPLIRVGDEKSKQLVTSAFENLKKGIPATIASKRTLADFGLSDDISIDSLTQPDFADKIQYTAKLYDDVLRWHFTRYGHAIKGNGKAAQESVDETNSTTSQAMILPLAMLKRRRETVEKVNALYGTNISVNFSGSWRAEVTAYETETGEPSIDDSPDDENASLSDSVPTTPDDVKEDDLK